MIDIQQNENWTISKKSKTYTKTKTEKAPHNFFYENLKVFLYNFWKRKGKEAPIILKKFFMIKNKSPS